MLPSPHPARRTGEARHPNQLLRHAVPMLLLDRPSIYQCHTSWVLLLLPPVPHRDRPCIADARFVSSARRTRILPSSCDTQPVGSTQKHVGARLSFANPSSSGLLLSGCCGWRNANPLLPRMGTTNAQLQAASGRQGCCYCCCWHCCHRSSSASLSMSCVARLQGCNGAHHNQHTPL